MSAPLPEIGQAFETGQAHLVFVQEKPAWGVKRFILLGNQRNVKSPHTFAKQGDLQQQESLPSTNETKKRHLEEREREKEREREREEEMTSKQTSGEFVSELVWLLLGAVDCGTVPHAKEGDRRRWTLVVGEG